MVIQMIYQKANGQLVFRIRTTIPPYKIGDRTSMGWIVKDIRYKYKDKFLTRHDFDVAIDNDWKKDKKKKQIKENLLNLYKYIVYSTSLLLLFRLFELSFVYNIA